MKWIDRPGIFKAVPFAWRLRDFENSQALAIEMEFELVAKLENGEWQDWSQFEPHQVRGQFFIIKKDGAVNEETHADLVTATGWDGELRSVNGNPPNVLVQVTVKDEQYNGKTYFKASFIRHGDYSPKPREAPPEKVAALSGRFDSLLRASAAVAKQSAAAPAMAPAPRAVMQTADGQPPPETPFGG